MLKVPAFEAKLPGTFAQLTGLLRLLADCRTKPTPVASGHDNVKFPPVKLADRVGNEISLTVRFSNNEKSKEGCRVVLAFTSESPRAILFPPSGARLAESIVAIAVLSMVHFTMLPILMRSTLCHAKPKEPICVWPA